MLVADVELTPTEIADLRAGVALQSIQVRHGAAPFVHLTIIGGLLGGMALTMAEDARCHGLVSWRVERAGEAIIVVHRREGDLLRFARVVKSGL